MIKGVVAEIVYVFTCVQYKDEVSDESILLETSRDQNQAAEQKGSSLEWLVLLEGGITVGIVHVIKICTQGFKSLLKSLSGAVVFVDSVM